LAATGVVRASTRRLSGFSLPLNIRFLGPFRTPRASTFPLGDFSNHSAIYVYNFPHCRMAELSIENICITMVDNPGQGPQ
jgi:hypothetical protein